VDQFTYIAIEDLNIKGPARGMLAKSAANAAWNQRVRHYNAEYAGTVVSMIDPRGTSQTCRHCGTIQGSFPRGGIAVTAAVFFIASCCGSNR
jgi:transposase